jgi:hypothetical protein
MDAEQELTRIKELGKARAKKHYDANKEAINQKRREAYLKKKAISVPATEPSPEPVEAKAKHDIDFNEILKGVKDLNISNRSTEEKYIADLLRLMRIVNSRYLDLYHSKDLIEMINSSKRPNGAEYSENTKKSIYQAILFIIDNLKLNIKKKPYEDQFNIKKMISIDQNEEKMNNEEVPTFKEYLAKCKAMFGVDSKEYLIAKFYEELTLRDDFGLILTNEINDDKNYLLLSPTKLTIVINSYKTNKKYGQIKHKLSKSLETLTKKYILKHKVSLGDYLFGESKLSNTITKMNQALGYSGGINLFRHMKITQVLNKESNHETRLKLAAAMKHSNVIQKAYLRKAKLL